MAFIASKQLPVGKAGLVGAALLCTPQPSCAAPRTASCYPDSRFTSPALYGDHPLSLERLASDARPEGVSCALVSSGFRDTDQVLYVLQPKDASPSAVLHVWTADGNRVAFEAPLDDRLARMITEVCVETVAQRADCRNSGLDGVWYLLQAPDGERSAVAWSPRPGTSADSVIDMFTALRAYVGSQDALRVPALQTLYRETYATYSALGLLERERAGQ